jgi:hypothetical protein
MPPLAPVSDPAPGSGRSDAGELGDGGRSRLASIAGNSGDPREDRMMVERGFRPVMSEDHATDSEVGRLDRSGGLSASRPKSGAKSTSLPPHRHFGARGWPND